MTYSELIQLYFERSGALQGYWTLYVVIIGGLLAFSSLRKQPDLVTSGLVTVLFLCFAYKNLGAIQDTSTQRAAVVQLIKQRSVVATAADRPGNAQERELLEPTLDAPDLAGTRNFHVACDLLTIAALWAMEFRRMRRKGSAPSPA